MSDQDPELVYNIIHEIQKEGQISEETANACKEKFYRVHELLMQNLQNEKKLVEESRILKQQLSQEIQKLEQAQNNQKANEDTLKDLTDSINGVKKEIDAVEEQEAVLRAEIFRLLNDKTDLENDLKNRKEKERERLIPEIEAMKNRIKDLKAKEQNNKKLIEMKERENQHLEEYNKELEAKAGHKEENEKLNTEFLNIKNDPDRWSKKNKSFENEVGVLQKQVDAIKESIQKIEGKKKKIEEATKAVEDACTELKKKKEQKETLINELQDKIREKEKLMNENLTRKSEIDRERNETERRIKLLKEDKRSVNEKKNQLIKDIEAQKHSYKKIEYQLNNYQGLVKEHENKIGATTKMYEEKMKENKQQLEYDKKVYEENQLFFGVLVSKRLEEKKMDSDKENTKLQIQQLEQQVANLQEEENKLIEEIKFLSTIREKMARTASQAMAQARETKEELKVKELLILDLNKKFQETEFRLNSFIALYEEVKNARNKYVSLIQNSSQDLAEMKERIKILQNEVEILRNE
jgi:chromosome segregation ATPase